MFLLPDQRDWVQEDHLVLFIMEAAGWLNLSPASINHRGTGKDQYPPSMMLGLLMYCYATGTFSSRRIKRPRGAVSVRIRLLRVDEVTQALDGKKILANVSKDNSISPDRYQGAGQRATPNLKNEPQTSSQTKPTKTRDKGVRIATVPQLPSFQLLSHLWVTPSFGATSSHFPLSGNTYFWLTTRLPAEESID